MKALIYNSRNFTGPLERIAERVALFYLQQQKFYRSFRVRQQNGGYPIYNSRNFTGPLEGKNPGHETLSTTVEILQVLQSRARRLLPMIYNSRNFTGPLEKTNKINIGESTTVEILQVLQSPGRDAEQNHLQQQKFYRSFRVPNLRL